MFYISKFIMLRDSMIKKMNASELKNKHYIELNATMHITLETVSLLRGLEYQIWSVAAACGTFYASISFSFHQV